MNYFKAVALTREFSFLSFGHDGPKVVRLPHFRDGEIAVRRADERLAEMVPYWHSQCGDLVSIHERQAVHFVLRDGTVLDDAVKQDQVHESYYGHEGRTTRTGESILSAVGRLGIADQLEFVVLVEKGIDEENRRSTAEWRATVYRPSRRQTWRQALGGEVNRAARELKRDVNQAWGV